MTTTLMPPIAVSPTLAANLAAGRLRGEGRAILHMGFGEAPFPAPPRLVRALAENAGAKSYLPSAGLPELRAAVLDHQARIAGIDARAWDVLVAPGSKLILYAVQMAVPGDLLLPMPSWVSYRPQAEMLGQRTIPVPTRLGDDGYVIAADDLARAIAGARAGGLGPTKLLLNYPNNPTGLTIPDEVLADVAQVCRREGILIVADEIYGRLAFDGTYCSIARHAPEVTVVTTGLSKHISVGGWRLGVGLVPKPIAGLFDRLAGIASETWSCVAAPIQRAAVEAYAGHPDVEAFVALSARIHADVTGYCAARFARMGVPCPTPQGGFYLWPDFGAARENGGNVATSDALAEALLEEAGIVALPGTAFGEAPETLRLRLSACDYDGAAALDAYDATGGASPAIGAFAPRIVAAMDAFARFAS